MLRITLAVALAASLGLSACGSTDFERGASGAAIGAVAASATGNNPVLGAAVGGAAGALCDNATPKLCK